MGRPTTLGKKADRNFYLPHYNAEAKKKTAQKRKRDETLKMANDGRSPVRNRRNSAGAAASRMKVLSRMKVDC